MRTHKNNIGEYESYLDSEDKKFFDEVKTQVEDNRLEILAEILWKKSLLDSKASNKSVLDTVISLPEEVIQEILKGDYKIEFSR